MDLTAYHNNLRNLTTSAAQRMAEAAVIPAGMRLLGTIKNRIARDGQATDGSEIGQYSTVSGYYGKKQFVKKSSFKPQGNPKSNRNPNPRKTMFLEQGYRELRAIQGRPVDKVNLNYTGDLLASYQAQKVAEAVLLGLNNASQVGKRKGLEAKYGDVFHAQRGEIAVFNREVDKAVTDNLLKTLRSGSL
jgi:hypothetical protein